MKLSKEDLEQLANIAVDAAEKAGKLIQSYRNKDFVVTMKPDGDGMASQIVTEVDRLSQDIILELLLPTCTTYDLGLLAEEDKDDGSRHHKAYFWCVDPIDGTWPFSQGVSGYSVSIALVAQTGEPVIGVVYDPVKMNSYVAIHGQGVKRNGADWHPSTSGTNLTLFVDRSFPKLPYFDQLCDRLKKAALGLGYTNLGIHVNGGSVLSALYCLEQQPGIYLKFPKHTDGGGSIWDFAATACIYKEAKGHVSDVFGAPLKLNRNDGTTFMNKEGVLYVLDTSFVKEVMKLYNSLM